MPTYERGDYLIPIEKILDMDHIVLLNIVDKIVSSEKCRCTVSDYPSIASIVSDDNVIDIVVGVSSIVCNKGCTVKHLLEEKGIPYYEFSSTAWIYGRLISSKKECITTAESLAFLENNLQPLAHHIPWTITSFNKIFEIIPRERKNAFSLILPNYDPLGFIQQQHCGRIRARNPLYPGAALGKLGIELCINHYVKIIGPFKRKIVPIIDIGNEPLISLYSGLGDFLLLHANSNHLHPIVLKALTLAIAYMCGEGD